MLQQSYHLKYLKKYKALYGPTKRYSRRRIFDSFQALVHKQTNTIDTLTKFIQAAFIT